jgi:uncharacterized protein
MSRSFLTAHWANLILAQYPVADEQLLPHLPPGVELDRWDGSAWVSLVGFQFLDTRVLRVSWPTFRHFPEWNLRAYVRHGGHRGVVFVREFVPQRFVAWVARTIYNEQYRAAPMSMMVAETPMDIAAEYGVHYGGRRHTLRAGGSKPAVRPGPDSLEHFFKEHSWGFGTTHRGRLMRYEVQHPEWDVYPVRECQVDVDWAALYGPAWAGMNGRSPASVVFAAGSAVSVFPKGAL